MFGRGIKARLALLEAAQKEAEGRVQALQEQVDLFPDKAGMMELQDATLRSLEKVNAMIARLRKKELAELRNGEQDEDPVDPAQIPIPNMNPKAELRRRAAQLRGAR